ncbi:hypothetical protein Q5P01_013967 [Channa striata]|uniref:Uncharacterized protein n=1 Tax=Channa striata TaxID=64152 RepID=A0AA88MKB0_CHASR|nr:hypothetical protein Q5P01_013967 [Channa striata]
MEAEQNSGMKSNGEEQKKDERRRRKRATATERSARTHVKLAAAGSVRDFDGGRDKCRFDGNVWRLGFLSSPFLGAGSEYAVDSAFSSETWSISVSNVCSTMRLEAHVSPQSSSERTAPGPVCVRY